MRTGLLIIRSAKMISVVFDSCDENGKYIARAPFQDSSREIPGETLSEFKYVIPSSEHLSRRYWSRAIWYHRCLRRDTVGIREQIRCTFRNIALRRIRQRIVQLLPLSCAGAMPISAWPTCSELEALDETRPNRNHDNLAFTGTPHCILLSK